MATITVAGRTAIGTFVAWHNPFFTVQDARGAHHRLRSTDATGVILFSPRDFFDFERCFCDWERWRPTSSAGWRTGSLTAVAEAGLTAPAVWLDPTADTVNADVSSTGAATEGRFAAFRETERPRLKGVFSDLSGQARAKKTIAGLGNYALKGYLVAREPRSTYQPADRRQPCPRPRLPLRANAGAPQKSAEACAFLVKGTGPHQLKHIERTRVAYKQGASPKTSSSTTQHTQTSDSRLYLLYYYTLPSSRLVHQSDFIPGYGPRLFLCCA